jgi:hypothetical protein
MLRVRERSQKPGARSQNEIPQPQWLSEKPSKRCVRGQKSPRQPLRVCRPPLSKGAAKAQPSGGFIQPSGPKRMKSYSDRLLVSVPRQSLGTRNRNWIPARACPEPFDFASLRSGQACRRAGMTNQEIPIVSASPLSARVRRSAHGLRVQ